VFLGIGDGKGTKRTVCGGKNGTIGSIGIDMAAGHLLVIRETK
jgi:hypothetical protein